MVRNLVYNLYESLVENIDGIADISNNTLLIPIIYFLTDNENNILVDSENYQLIVRN